MLEGSQKAKGAAEKNKEGFYFNQADALEDATLSYSKLGSEFGEQLKKEKINPDALISVIGSGGLLLGISSGMKKIFPKIKIYAIELEISNYLYSKLKKQKPVIKPHHFWGISAEGSTRIKEELLKIVDYVILINESEMESAVKRFPKQLGISVDYPTASNIMGAEELIKKGLSKIATIWAGHGWRTLD